jgi:hypothetical protein
MTNVNKIPFNEIPHSEAFHPERGPLWQKLFNLLDQSRNKLGGDSDYIVSLQEDTRATIANVATDYDVNVRIKNLQAQNAQLKAGLASTSRQLRNLEKKLTAFIAEARTNG